MTPTPNPSAGPHDDLPLAPSELIAAYERGISDLAAAVAGMTSTELVARPITGKWSTLEVVCHLADYEQFAADRIKRTISLERPLLMGTDSIQYLLPLNYQQHDVQEELDLVAATRRQLLRSLQRLPAGAWERTAVHSEAGLLTLRQLVTQAVHHLQHHLGFIAEKRAALQ